MLDKIVGALLGAPAEKLAEFYIKKQELKQELKLENIRGKIADRKAKTDLASERAKQVHSWEMAHIANSGWKDEFVLLVVSTPMIIGFIPGLDKHTLAGFEVMGKMPIWYQVLVVTIFLAIYGVRAYRGKNIVGRLLKNESS